MAIRHRKRNPFVKIGILCLALVMGLGLLNAGYAMWSETLYISGTVGTGEWNLGGTPGFWYHWDSHNTYTEEEIEGWLTDIDTDSAWLGAAFAAGEDDSIIGVMEEIFDAGEGGTAEEKFLRHYLAVWLNICSGRLNLTTVHNVTSISGYSYLGLATPASATLSEIIAAIESKFGTSPTDPEFLIMKDVSDALNNLLI